MPSPIVVSLTYGYTQQVFPFEGNGKLNGQSRTWLATDTVPMWQVTADETEEVATLAFTDGKAFDLLRYEGKLYRPVFSPGTHEPCDFEAFEEACKGEEVWLDSPFKKDGAGTHETKTRKPEVEGKTLPDPAGYRKLGESKREEVLTEMTKRAAAMLIVDGIVHVPCDEPVLVMKAPSAKRDAKPTAIEIHWAMPGLESDDDAVMGPTNVRFPADRQVTHSPSKNAGPVLGPRVDWTIRPWRVFGLSEFHTAKRFAEAYAATIDLPVKSDPSLVAVHRDWHLTVPAAPLDKYAKAAFDAVERHLPKVTRATAIDWYDARDAKEAGDHLGMLTSLERVLGREADRKLLNWGGSSSLTQAPNYSYSDRDISPDLGDATAGLLRYHLVERDRTLAIAMDDIDADALGEMDIDLETTAPSM